MKLKFVIGFALIAGILTIVVSILKDVRMLTTLYRMMISVVIFGVIGYICGYITEHLCNTLLAQLKPTGDTADVVSEPEEDIGSAQPTSNDFSPFTKNDFEHIS